MLTVSPNAGGHYTEYYYTECLFANCAEHPYDTCRYVKRPDAECR